MRLVIVESPYAGDVETNTEYARKAVRDSLGRGEAPIASHLLYTQPGILDDNIPDERQWGIDAGLAWREVAHACVIYADHGITKGMAYGIKKALDSHGIVEFRLIEEHQDLLGFLSSIKEQSVNMGIPKVLPYELTIDGRNANGL